MRLETHQLFAQLCEALLVEASTSLDMVKGQPGAQQVIQKLHTQMGLSHDQPYAPVAKIAWSELKDNYRGTWVLIKGDRGTGAIKYDGRTYNAVASAGGDAASFTNDRGGNIVDFLKGQIGQLRKFYVGKESGGAKEKKKEREDRNKVQGPSEVSVETLVTKFRPLWVKGMNTAIADIKGHVANQIKNDAFEKAKRKLERLDSLQNAVDALEAGATDTPNFISSAVNTAVLMAAHHYYPDTTGELRNSGYGRGSLTSQHSEGPRQLLKDISQGDTSKLGTILAFFKRTLISG